MLAEGRSHPIGGVHRAREDVPHEDRVELVVEAAPEDEDIKLDLFRRLDKVAAPDAILASNTSSIPLVKMASVTSRPANVVGVHFFNPVPVLPLVEIVASLLTAPETVTAVTEFVQNQLQKFTIASKDRAGFVVNALLVPYLLSAIRMLESGFASAEDIDTGMVKGCAHPMGPLALTDLIGLDTTAAVAQSMYEEFKEPLYAPPPLLMPTVSPYCLKKLRFTILRKSALKLFSSISSWRIRETKLLYKTTAGMAAAKPMAVATRASEIPGATTARLAEPV